MKRVTISEVKRLIGIQADPAISIYVGQGRSRADRLRELLRRASDMLAARLSRPAIDELLVPIVAKAARSRVHANGQAFLRSSGIVKAFAVPGEVPDLAIVAPAFHTKPLVRVLDGGERFVLLALGDGVAVAYEGDARGLAPMDLSLPGRERAPEAYVDEWYLAIDDALRSAMWDRGDPVVVAGTIERRERFAAVSRYPWVLEAGVECDLAQVHVADLHAEVARIVAAERAAVEAEAVSRYASARRMRGTSDDLADVARAAVSGRVPLLLHRRGAHAWGRVDPLTGECRLSVRSRPRLGEGDVIDDLTQLVLRAGGDVVEIAPDAMPSAAPVAAVVARPASLRGRSRRSIAERVVA